MSPALLQALICSLALLICLYAYYIESAKEHDEDFEALCDIGPRSSCSAVLTSECVCRAPLLASLSLFYPFTLSLRSLPSSYSRGMGIVGPLLGESHPLNISNAVVGLVFYAFIFFLGRCCRIDAL